MEGTSKGKVVLCISSALVSRRQKSENRNSKGAFMHFKLVNSGTDTQCIINSLV
jgi:hypothetical protein